MPDLHADTNDLIGRITTIIEENLSNERFGVSELAHVLNMSRSNLLRKVKHSTKLSASQLIRQLRLERGMELLRTTSLTVSQVSHQVGFGSTSYFIKCFREHYGYPPGEANKRSSTENGTDPGFQPRRKRWQPVFWILGIVALIAIGILVQYARPSKVAPSQEKSIAVLPFKNDSNDSTNLYLINGLMEATRNNLQKIKDLRVISRTSSEKYRNSLKSIPEMAEELNVNYFVEGSGQKIGNRLLLNIKLIDASSDGHLWARQYRREANDIFQLQQEVAKDIANEIQAIVTQEEVRQIEKKPTENLAAYDQFLKGLDLLHQGGRENLEGSIDHFEKAIGLDGGFALAHACAAIACYYLDIFQTQKEHTDQIALYADNALLHDPTLPESLIAKALFYAHKQEYQSAIPYFEKALEYNPNSILAINFLSDFYNWYVPNTTKYLEYALKGVQLDAAAHDSITMSLNYLHLSNALVQTGFLERSHQYIDKSLDYNPENSFSIWVKAVLMLVGEKNNTEQSLQLMRDALEKDSSQLHLLQEIGKIYHYEGDDENAYRYYKRFIELRKTSQLEVFQQVDLTIATVLSKMGLEKEAENYVASFKEFADNDQSIYKHMHLAMYHLYQKNSQKAMEHLKLFAQEDNYQYWILLLPQDPIMDPIRNHPDFKDVINTIESKFWDRHREIKASLEEKGLLD